MSVSPVKSRFYKIVTCARTATTFSFVRNVFKRRSLSKAFTPTATKSTMCTQKYFDFSSDLLEKILSSKVTSN